MKKDDDQLDRYLSGETALEELPEGLRLEEERLRALMESLGGDVRAPLALRDAVMREVAEIPVPLWRQLADWCLRPRTLRLSPAAGALAMAVSAALLLLWPGSVPTTDPAAATGASSEVVTRFVFVAGEASSVHLTGDFVSWSREGIVLEDLRGTGIWIADVSLAPGVYQYTFIVNGTEWRPDPRAVSQVDDGFGQMNSVIIVSAESEA